MLPEIDNAVLYSKNTIYNFMYCKRLCYNLKQGFYNLRSVIIAYLQSKVAHNREIIFLKKKFQFLLPRGNVTRIILTKADKYCWLVIFMMNNEQRHFKDFSKHVKPE